MSDAKSDENRPKPKDHGRHALAVSGLSQNAPTAFEIAPSPDSRAAIAGELGLSDVRKLRFEGEIRSEGKRDWVLSATLGATIVQPCVVTLDPVVTRIDAPVERRFLSQWDGRVEAGSETEMPEDVTQEPLRSHIDPEAIMLEALALHAPDFPRKPDAELGEVVVSEPGTAPLRDEDVKPFAGLAALKAQLEGKGE